MLKKSLLLLGIVTAISGATVAQSTSAASTQQTDSNRRTQVQKPSVRPQGNVVENADDARAAPPINPCALHPLTTEERQRFEREWMGIHRLIWE